MKAFIISELISVLCVCDKKGKSISFESRYSDCFILPLKGKIRFSFCGKSYTASKEAPIYITKGLKYTNTCLETAESIVINFNTLNNENCARPLSHINSSVIRQYYKSLSEHTAAANFSFIAFSELYTLAAMLFKDGIDNDSTPKINTVNAAISYMNENYGNPLLSISEIANYCSISDIYLRKLFRVIRHTSPHSYLTYLRMNKAYLLCLEKRPIKEIALRVGYSDVYQFSRAYKKHFGFSPTETMSE